MQLLLQQQHSLNVPTEQPSANSRRTEPPLQSLSTLSLHYPKPTPQQSSTVSNTSARARTFPDVSIPSTLPPMEPLNNTRPTSPVPPMPPESVIVKKQLSPSFDNPISTNDISQSLWCVNECTC
uniref:Uncharacterized protein n=1 Tax=Moniliophthora roreri TaxID=221103 RepID=A0A0W0FAB1_MONRR